MRVLVTGGAGFIGSHTVDKLLKIGHEVRILDNLQKPVHLYGKPKWIPREAEFIFGDIREKDLLKKCLKGIDAIYHFAAYQDYLPNFSKFFQVNAVGTALLYETILEMKLDIAKVIVASSQFVQGEGIYKCKSCEIVSGVLMRSDSQLSKCNWEHNCIKCGNSMEWQWTTESYSSPPNAYALAKHSQEIQSITFGKRYNIPSVALRYSIVQGPRQSFYNAYSGACRIFSLNYYFKKEPILYEDGLQCRDFINIHDVVAANIMALENDKMNFEVFNVGGGYPYTVKDFAEIVREEFNKRNDSDLPPPKIPKKYRFGDTRNACSNIEKLKALGWNPSKSPHESVTEYVNWLYNQKNVKDILDYAEKTMNELNVIRSATYKNIA